MYESLNTDFVSNPRQLDRLRRDLIYFGKNDRLNLIDDRDYRDRALDECLSEIARPSGSRRRLSMVDRILRAILTDRTLKVEAVITNDPAAFWDVCRKACKEMIRI